MKAKTKKRLQRVVFYFIIVVFVAGLGLAYLPVTQPAAPVAPTAPPVEQPGAVPVQ